MKMNKILTIPVALLILLATTVVPTMACTPSTHCGQANMEVSGSSSDITDMNIAVITGDTQVSLGIIYAGMLYGAYQGDVAAIIISIAGYQAWELCLILLPPPVDLAGALALL